MSWYCLQCEPCGEVFRGVLADEPSELLMPDFEVVKEQAGETNAEFFRGFHERHSGRGHRLVVAEAEVGRGGVEGARVNA